MRPEPSRLEPPTGALTREEVDQLHHWFWLRLASSPAALREATGVEVQVRHDAATFTDLTETAIAALSWDELVGELEFRAAISAVAARPLIVRLRARLSPVTSPMGVDATGCDLLILGTALFRFRALDQLGKAFAFDRLDDAIEPIAHVIEADDGQVAEHLAPLGRLKLHGLLVRRSSPVGLGQIVEPLRVLRSQLYRGRPLDDAVLSSFCRPLLVSPTASADLEHLSESIQIVQAFLRAGPSARVLIHGRTGVGKTEFIHAVIRQLGWQAYGTDLKLLSAHQLLNDPHIGSEAAYAVLRRRPNTLIVLDHATQVLQSSDRDFRNYLDLLEVPTLWVSTSLEAIDEDILDRFDYRLQLEPPAPKARVELLSRLLRGHGISDHLLPPITSHPDFVPGDAVRLARVVPTLIAQGIAPDVAVSAMADAGETRAPVPVAGRRRDGLPYRMEWINATSNLHRLVDGLSRTAAGTLLFSGPPGTGKTEFARHLATRLGRPLLIRGASDLNHPYVGQTEKAMAEAFGAACRSQSILLIDEIDSVLRSRESAVRSWEVAHVNEMLTQLDRFEGIAIFTTNSCDSLDSAVMRRIDRKIEFDYLNADQRWEVVMAAADALQLPGFVPDQGLRQHVRALSQLALGDVAVTLRAERLERTLCDVRGLVAALDDEIRRRLKRSRPMGFVPMS